MGPVLVACLIVVLGTTMIPAFAAGTGNPTDTSEQNTTNCCCGADNDVVDIDGNNNTVRIIVNGDSGGVDTAAASASDPGTDQNAETGGGTVDVRVDDGDVRVNGEDVADEDSDGMTNQEARDTVARIVANVDGTTVTNDDVDRIVDENDINGGDTDGLNVGALVDAINDAADDADTGGTDATAPPTDDDGADTDAPTDSDGADTATPADGTDDDAEAGDGDNTQTVGDVDDSTVLQFLLDQDFIDRSELNAAIQNNSIDNSTILANIVNGDQTINVDSRYVDNSVTNIDNSVTLTQIIENSTVITDSDNNTVDNGDNETTGTTTPGTTPADGGTAAPDISVDKTTDTDQVEIGLLDQGGILQADDPATFTVTVTNEGNATADDVVVNDDDVIADIANNDILDTTVFLVTDSDTSQGDFSAATGDFEVGSLDPGESATLTFDALAVSTDAGLLDGSLADLNATNDAALTASTPDDPNADNDADSATITLVSALDGGLTADQLAALNDAFTDAQVDDLQAQLTTDQLVALLDSTSDLELASIGDALGNDDTTVEDLGDAIDGDNLDGFLDGLLTAGATSATATDTAGAATNATGAASNATDAAATATDDVANASGSATDTDGSANATNATADQSAASSLSTGGLAVGGVSLLGLLGSAVLFKRD